MIYMFLAEGFEETEAIAPLDILRRAELEIATVGVGRKTVTGSHGISVVADVMDCEIMPDENCQGIILPGGMPGTLNLEKSETVGKFIEYAVKNNLVIGAICAAPSVLGHKGILMGKKQFVMTALKHSCSVRKFRIHPFAVTVILLLQ